MYGNHWYSRPINYMAKSEYFKGITSFFFKMTGYICINRKGMSVSDVNWKLKERISGLIKENLESGYWTIDEYEKAEKYFVKKIIIDTSDFIN